MGTPVVEVGSKDRLPSLGVHLLKVSVIDSSGRCLSLVQGEVNLEVRKTWFRQFSKNKFFKKLCSGTPLAEAGSINRLPSLGVYLLKLSGKDLLTKLCSGTPVVGAGSKNRSPSLGVYQIKLSVEKFSKNCAAVPPSWGRGRKIDHRPHWESHVKLHWKKNRDNLHRNRETPSSDSVKTSSESGETFIEIGGK